MPIADRAKGAVPVRVRLKVPADEEGQYLKPEMGAIVRFYDEIIEDTSPSASSSSTDHAPTNAEAEVDASSGALK
jgi:hypothetical protein